MSHAMLIIRDCQLIIDNSLDVDEIHEQHEHEGNSRTSRLL